MKKTLALAILLSSISSFASMRIEIRHSEAASFLHFLNTGFDEPHTSLSMKEIIKSEKDFSDPETIKDFESFKSFVQEGYNYPDELKNRPEGFWAEDSMKVLAASSTDLRSFETQLSAFLPYRGISSYFRVKEKLYPIFKKLIWDPSEKKRTENIEKNQEDFKKFEMVDWLMKARTFYRSDYPIDLPFKVALIPIPDEGIKSKHTSAENLRDVQIVPYLLSEKTTDNLDVIFHEFMHALYEGQSQSVMKEIDSFYLSSQDSHALFVYRYINEALATAWGNGWFYEIINKNPNSKSWYNVEYINVLAKAYLPILKDWVQNNKVLDKEFMQKTLEIAKQYFPNVYRELAPNLINLRVFTNSNSLTSNLVSKILNKYFRIQSFHNSTIEPDFDWSSLTKRELRNTVLVTTNKDVTLRKLQSTFKIKSLGKTHGNNFLVVIPHNGNYIFWVNTMSEKKLSRLFGKLKDQKVLPEKPSTFTL
jgi:hypothetical protein